ncbi:glycosyltransferase [Leucobacter sp. USCH14]|uniref:glycosyltransferase n=1 Tax=Leucobacter sp. USCH14 TaxID=3024838 RepID=UPI0030A6BE19
MRIAIASRIFEPEPSAASFRLAALARALVENGHEVEILTVRPPARLRKASDSGRGYRVKRFPVLRDSSGYVRGYLPYLSFDVPLFFRLLLGRRRDLIVSEPPPTTGFFVRLAAAFLRTPYAYYAADIWSDAASQTDAPAWMVRTVRALESFALRGARSVLSVSDGVTRRLSEFSVADVSTIGNGVDAARFSEALTLAQAETEDLRERNDEFVYAGTASEWHGANVFVEALPAVLRALPRARLRFIGGGSEREALERRARELGVEGAVAFEPVLSAELIAPVLAGATAAIASVQPGAGYDFAFPTKLYSAAVCGAPLIYAGIGPAENFVRTPVDGLPLGTAVAHDPTEVAAAMVSAARLLADVEPEAQWRRRRRVSRWATENVGLQAVAARAVAVLTKAVRP